MNLARVGRLCQFGGVGGIIAAFFLAIYTVASLPASWPRRQRVNCVNNLKQIGLSFRTWALDNGDLHPFNLSTNSGGTMEERALGPDGFDVNSYLHFQVMSNDLTTPLILVCPQDTTKKAAADFGRLQASN